MPGGVSYLESNKPQVSFRKVETQVKQDWILLDLDLEEGYEESGKSDNKEQWKWWKLPE